MGLSFFQQIQKRDRNFTVILDDTEFPVEVVENERAKRLTLRIVPGGTALRVTTPPFVGDDELEAFVARNRNWAAVRIARLPRPQPIVHDSTIPFMGTGHRIVFTGGLRGVVERICDTGNPQIHVPGEEQAASRKLLAWMKQQARRELDQRVNRHARTLGVRPRRLRITDTTSRWGSCSTTRTLSFSWRIVMAPPEVIDYLAAHEVAHLVEMNHSSRFWDLTHSLCPHTDSSKRWLKTHGSRLHAITV